MARNIKKLSKRAFVSFFWLGGFVISLFVGFVVGNNNSNLSKLDSKAKGVISDSNFVSSARADIPSACSGPGPSCACTSCGSCSGCGGGGGDGGGGGGGDGA